MLLEDILALACLIFFGGWLVTRYYIWKYSRVNNTKSLQNYEQSRRRMDSLRLQAKIAGAMAIITFVLFNLVYEKNPEGEVIRKNELSEVQSVDTSAPPEKNF